MAEQLDLSNAGNDRESTYQSLMPQVEALISDESDLVANLANVTAVLKQAFQFFWVGFYLVKDEELVLGPFQGTLACTRIDLGKGVCGTAWAEKQSQLVPDVDAFPGHIACSSESRSEVVVPIMLGGEVVAVLDVDSDQLDDFSQVDVTWLEQLAALMARQCFS
mgnify:CR=1 FL=1